MAKKTTTFLAIILTLNNFVLNCKQYLKVKGCDMGMVCAPLHVNIFMDHFENKCIYTFLQGTTLTYLQFIDDIFFIRTDTKEQPTNCLNNTTPSSLNIKNHKLALNFLIQKSPIKIINLLPKSIRKVLTTKTSFK